MNFKNAKLSIYKRDGQQYGSVSVKREDFG